MYFTSGETFSSTKIAHFLRASSEAGQRNPLLHERSGAVPRRLGPGVHARADQGLPRAGGDAPRVSPGRDDRRRVGRHRADESVDAVPLRRRSRARARAAGGRRGHHRAAPGELRARRSTCFTNDLAPDSRRTCTSTPWRPASWSRRVSSIATPGIRCSRRGGTACRRCRPRRSRTSPTTTSCSSPTTATACSMRRRSTVPAEARGRAFVGVMAQVNSGNYGYNLPLKYRGADLYSLNRLEAELCLHDRTMAVGDLVERSAGLLGGRVVSVTDGARGAAIKMDGVRYSPAVAQPAGGRHDWLRRRVFRAERCRGRRRHVTGRRRPSPAALARPR